VVTVYENEGATKKFFVSSGTITINEDSSVQILAEEAHHIADIDAAEAKKVSSTLSRVSKMTVLETFFMLRKLYVF
jgi:F-type H+-transporting ATPase subunit delta